MEMTRHSNLALQYSNYVNKFTYSVGAISESRPFVNVGNRSSLLQLRCKVNCKIYYKLRSQQNVYVSLRKPIPIFPHIFRGIKLDLIQVFSAIPTDKSDSDVASAVWSCGMAHLMMPETDISTFTREFITRS